MGNAPGAIVVVPEPIGARPLSQWEGRLQQRTGTRPLIEDAWYVIQDVSLRAAGRYALSSTPSGSTTNG